VPPGEIWRHYADADIYLQSPDIDNMPLSVLEAFASGLPVVSTRAGGVPAMLTEGVHGLLAPLDDDAAMARCALRLLDDPGLARRLAKAAYTSTDAFAWGAVRERWLAAYRRLARQTMTSPLCTVEPA
jgi:glycosyltransferase involved in cell wall biosynthesis